jgi:hypothetical protein
VILATTLKKAAGSSLSHEHARFTSVPHKKRGLDDHRHTDSRHIGYAAALDLSDGDQLCDLLIDLKLGVRAELVEQVTIDPNWFAAV